MGFKRIDVRDINGFKLGNAEKEDHSFVDCSNHDLRVLVVLL